MSVGIGEFAFDGMGDLAMVDQGGAWGLGLYDGAENPMPFGDFDLQDWDALPSESSFGCACGLGAPPKAGDKPVGFPKKGFPWMPVVAGVVGLAAGVGLAFGLRRLLKK